MTALDRFLKKRKITLSNYLNVFNFQRVLLAARKAGAIAL